MDYYDGVHAFNEWRWSLSSALDFDWADLTESERRSWARREQDAKRIKELGLDNQEG